MLLKLLSKAERKECTKLLGDASVTSVNLITKPETHAENLQPTFMNEHGIRISPCLANTHIKTLKEIFESTK